VDNAPVAGRIMFMFVTVFLVSLLLFSYNFFWKYSITPRMRGITMTAITNFFLILAASLILLLFASLIFKVRAPIPYLMFYFFRNLIIAVVVVLVTYVVELIERLKQEKIELLTLQHQNAETELAALRSQIDPHYLFNTLTTLSSLVRANSNETISFIDHMADTFRYMLENRTQKVVKVRDELSFLHSYVFMMKKRFGEGLDVVMSVSDEYLDKEIPQFALQAVVENATKHNIVSIKKTLRIELTSRDNCITVRNNLREKKSANGYGIGLTNLVQRYWLIGKKKIQVTKGDDFFEVTLPLL
jgi:LytS/YehU family sensor histidine kinase